MELLGKSLLFLLTIIEVVLLFNLFIFVHELGHFWAARWRGLRVDKFQVWFGPTIWRKKINGVQWGLGTIPLGGFVALPQMAPMEAIEGGPEGAGRESLPPISPLDKIIVAFAGPLFSLLLAFAFAVLVWQFGKPESIMEATRTVGYLVEDGPADKSGALQIGDEILEVDGEPVPGFGGLSEGIIARVAFSESETVRLKIRRPGVADPFLVELRPDLAPKKGFFSRSSIKQIGVAPAAAPLVHAVNPDGPAALAGLEKGDRFVAVNGNPVTYQHEVMEAIEEHDGKPMTLSVERETADGLTTFDVQLTPVRPLGPVTEWRDYTQRPMIGISWLDETVLEKPGPDPWTQVKKSAMVVFVTLDKLLDQNAKIDASHLSSPVGIGGAIFDMLMSEYGWQRAMWFCVIINVNLAILNLMPLPVLDGGHITLALLEWIRGRTVNFRFLEIIQTAFALLLLGFMFYVVILDVGDRLGRGGGAEPIVIEFPPPEETATP